MAAGDQYSRRRVPPGRYFTDDALQQFVVDSGRNPGLFQPEEERLSLGQPACAIQLYEVVVWFFGHLSYRSPGYGLSPRIANHRIRFSVSSSALSSSSKSSSIDLSANSFAFPLSFSTGLFISSSGTLFFTSV